jgi:hypothetical protein
MKKALTLSLCFVAFAAIASAVIVEEHPVFLNGKAFAKAVMIHGVWAIPLQDFAKAAGANVSLEPYLQLQGSTLRTRVTFHDLHAVKQTDKASARTTGASDVFAKIVDIKGESLDDKQRSASTLFHIQKVGVISTNVLMQNGKAYLPLVDVAKAFGNVSWRAPVTLKPNEAISLNYTKISYSMLGE